MQPSTAGETSHRSKRWPVSVKGVIIQDSKVILLKNERDEWELPGGKLDAEETPEECVVREVKEELTLSVTCGPILGSWVYHVLENADVLVITYGVYSEPFTQVAHSSEHKGVELFSLEEVKGLRMPQGYKESIATWAQRVDS